MGEDASERCIGPSPQVVFAALLLSAVLVAGAVARVVQGAGASSIASAVILLGVGEEIARRTLRLRLCVSGSGLVLRGYFARRELPWSSVARLQWVAVLFGHRRYPVLYVRVRDGSTLRAWVTVDSDEERREKVNATLSALANAEGVTVEAWEDCGE